MEKVFSSWMYFLMCSLSEKFLLHECMYFDVAVYGKAFFLFSFHGCTFDVGIYGKKPFFPP